MSRMLPLILKSREVLSFMCCIRFTWDRRAYKLGHLLGDSLTHLSPWGQKWQPLLLARPLPGKGSGAVFTLDFLDSWIRNFSYCSMAKTRLGIGLVSRRTLAYRQKDVKTSISSSKLLKFSCSVLKKNPLWHLLLFLSEWWTHLHCWDYSRMRGLSLRLASSWILGLQACAAERDDSIPLVKYLGDSSLAAHWDLPSVLLYDIYCDLAGPFDIRYFQYFPLMNSGEDKPVPGPFYILKGIVIAVFPKI